MNKVTNIHLIAENIPLYDYIDNVNWAQYKLSGESVLSAMTDFTYSATWDGGSETLQGDVHGDASSILKIDFSKE